MSKNLTIEAATEEMALHRVLGRELADVYRQRTAWIRENPELAVSSGGASDHYVKDQPSDQVFWWGLQSLLESDPDAAKAVWDGIISEQEDELLSGHRAQQVLAIEDRPIERARFLVLRGSFRKDWGPRNGIEDALIDMLAQAFTMWEMWMGQLRMQSFFEGRQEKGGVDQKGRWTAPTIGTAEALEQSAAMADRFNKIYLRTLRALRDLRRYPVVIQNANQVNVGDQQVNVAADRA